MHKKKKLLQKQAKISVRTKLSKINDFILDILFPISCISCGKENIWLCKKCLEKIKTKQKQTCPICEKLESINGETCFKCKNKYSLDGLLICTDYQENKIIKKAIHFYKYRFVKDFYVSLGKIIQQKIIRSSTKLPDVIIPIPLHKKRLRWRGFNQSSLLAYYVSQNITPGFNILVNEKDLVRKKNTVSQMNIKNYQERKNNLRHAFELATNKNIIGKNILLIDDVATTGSTLFECAKVLKKSGAKKVFGVVIARPKPKN